MNLMSPGHFCWQTNDLSQGVPFASSFAYSHLLRQGWGAGSARTVNRRYIALFVAYKDRTWASALFVSLSAVGMALGPLLSLPLSLFPTRRFAGLTFDHVRS